MSVKTVDLEAVIKPDQNSDSKDHNYDMSSACVFLCVAQAMKDKLQASLDCTKMSADEREKQIIEQALENLKGLDESKYLVDKLLQMTKESKDTNLHTWLLSIKSTLDAVIAKKDKAYQDFLDSLHKEELDENIVKRLEDDISKNEALLAKYKKDFKKVTSELPDKCDLEKIIADATYIAAYSAIIKSEKLLLVAAKTKLGKEILENEVFKDLAGDGNSKDWLNVRNAITVVLMSPVIAAVFDVVVSMITDGKETGMQLIDKGYDWIDKKIKHVISNADKNIDSLEDKWDSNSSNGWNSPTHDHISIGFMIAVAYITKYGANGVLSFTNNKNEKFSVNLDKDTNGSLQNHAKMEAYENSGLSIINNQESLAASYTQDIIQKNTDARNDYIDAIKLSSNLSKILSI